MSPFKRNIIYILLPMALSFFLLWGSVMLSGTIVHWRKLRAEVGVAGRELENLRAMKREIERRRRLVSRVEEFVKRATYLGLDPSRWDQYDVDIKRQISFGRLREVLAQTCAGNNYYFEPLMLYLAKSPPNKQEQQGGSEPPGGPNSPGGKKGEGGDIFLKLKGNFLVRR